MKLPLLLGVVAGSFFLTKCSAQPALQIVTPERVAVRALTVTPASFTVLLTDPPSAAPTFSLELLEGARPRVLPASATSADGHTFTLSARLPALREGSYQVSVLQGTLRAGPVPLFATAFYRRPSRLGTTGCLIWQRRAFFPIGLYHVNHTDAEYALLAANGFNTIQGSFSQDLPGFLQTLDLAQAHHLAVQVPLYTSNLVQANLPASIEKIRAMYRHPAVLSWKILDEPDADRNAAVREEVAPAYLALKHIDRLQPLELTLSENETLGFWSKASDLVQIDRYPLPGHALTQVSDFCAAAMKAKEPWQNLTYVVQCGYTPDLTTQPSFAQARAMVYLALASGAKGIAWYSRQEDNWDLTTTPLWPRLKEINAEITALSLPLLLGRDVAGIKCSEPSIHFLAKRYGNRVYLLATNPGGAALSPVFTLPGSLRVRHATLPMTGRTVQVALGAPDSATVILTL